MKFHMWIRMWRFTRGFACGISHAKIHQLKYHMWLTYGIRHISHVRIYFHIFFTYYVPCSKKCETGVVTSVSHEFHIPVLNGSKCVTHLFSKLFMWRILHFQTFISLEWGQHVFHVLSLVTVKPVKVDLLTFNICFNLERKFGIAPCLIL